MHTPPPQQPTFAEAEEIAANPDLQQLLRWYPDQEDRILAAYRRRHQPFAKVCNCPNCRRPRGRRPPARRRRTPSAAGRYREQLHK